MKLDSEEDGKVHDYRNTMITKELGLKTLRIKNEELENLNEVKEKISAILKAVILRDNTIAPPCPSADG